VRADLALATIEDTGQCHSCGLAVLGCGETTCWVRGSRPGLVLGCGDVLVTDETPGGL
jgi:hypothetical protein